MNEHVVKYVASVAEEAVLLRRAFHQIPEAGWQEYLTTWRVYQYLKQLSGPMELFVGKDALASDSRMGLPEHQCLAQARQRLQEECSDAWFLEQVEGGHTGLVAVFDSGQPGQNAVFRFDLDGLPIKESDNHDHLPAAESFQSRLKGSMHACGHDFHTVCGLLFARYLAENRQHLTGKVTLLFQPAEEGCRGAKAMRDAGWLKGSDYFISGHVGIDTRPAGTVAVRTTHFLATSKLNVRFSGRTAHAGVAPHEGRNALLAAASSTLNLHAIARHGEGSSRINVGRLEAGSGRNIIADHAEMELELRGETTAINQFMLESVRRVLEGAATMYDVELAIELVGEASAAHCDDELSDRLAAVLNSGRYIQQIVPHGKLGGSEDATLLMDEVQNQGGQAVYLLITSPTEAGHHHERFDIDEAVLPVMLESMILAVNELNGYS